MGSAYQQIVDRVKRDMSRRAIRDINGNAQVFENQVEKEVGYRLLQESLDNNAVNDFEMGTHGANGLHQTGELGTQIPSENQQASPDRFLGQLPKSHSQLNLKPKEDVDQQVIQDQKIVDSARVRYLQDYAKNMVLAQIQKQPITQTRESKAGLQYRLARLEKLKEKNMKQARDLIQVQYNDVIDQGFLKRYG